MTEEEFEACRLEHEKAWKLLWKNKASRYPVQELNMEAQTAVLETALARIHLHEKIRGPLVDHLAGVLLKAGVPASDDVVCRCLENGAAKSYPVPSATIEGLVCWVEKQCADSRLSVRLLTCLRKHHPAISHRESDKTHRSLMRRLAIALKLESDDAIPGPKDAWTSLALKWRDSLPDEDRQRWNALLELANEQCSSTPGKSYLRDAQAITSELPQFGMIMRDILASLGRAGPVDVSFRGRPCPWRHLLDEDFTDLLRALIFLCAPYSELTPHLRDAGARCAEKIKGIGPLCAKIAAACAEVLSRQEIATAAPALASLQSVVKHKSTRKSLGKAIGNVEQRSQVGWAIIEESTVPDFGFGTKDNPDLRAGDCTLSLGISRMGSPELIWIVNGKSAQTKPPLSVTREHPDRVTEMKALLREIKKVWGTQVQRLEKLMCLQRHLSLDTWRKHYLDHPVVGLLCRRLIWRVGGQLVSFSPPESSGQTGAPHQIDGTALIAEADALVTLCHPALWSESETHAWQKWVLGHRMNQPFQQALREVFTAAGAPSVIDDHRFSGEILHQGAFAALCRQRGWTYSFHGAPEQFEPHVSFAHADIRGVLRLSEEPDHAGRPLLWLKIQGIRFYRESTITYVAPETVPPIIFSETLRDVGLFLTASRAAKESGWRDGIPSEEK